jgi:hypothetical protein
MFDDRNAIRLKPDAEYVIKGGILLCGFDAEA